jgi:hypothetical protein
MAKHANNLRCGWMRGAALPVSLLLIAVSASTAAAHGDEAVLFNRDVRPILADTCFKCHGFDARARQAKLRLDLPDDAFVKHRHGIPIVPGHPEQSEAVGRLNSRDPDVMMPPPESHLTFTAAQTAILTRWIEQGAVYQQHWSLIPPRLPELPAVKDSAWVRNPIDRFILARLERDGLHPSPETDRRTLIRRASFDVTGIPPTPQDVEAFARDTSPDAYERLVDRLLASPRYGERMAQDWLDAARYADSNGYQGDPTRTMWPWRDWVVSSMNANIPFDEFAVEQIAGDLLPNATISQRLASGFNRNHSYNSEGGRISEETRLENVMDRVDTTATTFLGLTLGCSKCHDHKYDPFTQKEYYQLCAYFNQCSETGDGVPYDNGNAKPLLAMPTEAQAGQLATLHESQKAAQATLDAVLPRIDAAQTKWEETAAAEKTNWTVLSPVSLKAEKGGEMNLQPDGSVLLSKDNPLTNVYQVTIKTQISGARTLRLEAMPDDSLPYGGPGRSPTEGNFVLTALEAEVVSSGKSSAARKITFTGATATYEQPGFAAVGAIEKGKSGGWAVWKAPDKQHLAADFKLAAPLDVEADGELHLTLRCESQFAHHTLGRFRLSVTSQIPIPPPVIDILAVQTDKRSEAQKTAVRDFYRKNVSSEYGSLVGPVDSIREEAAQLEKSITKTMVMDDARPRETHVLFRGIYNKPLDKVGRGVPAALPPLPAGAPNNRLGLAKWIVDPANPLPARVMVNRYWQQFFGIGIVKTSDDFGTQSEPPVHPELLDWLAVRFVQSGWNVKEIQRLMLTSAVYRQSSDANPELLERDPQNRLLARGPRFRLSSFQIRDQALAVSGLLSTKIGGPPVKPYQPPGVWEEMSLDEIHYQQDKGESLYRRSLYTFWRRTVAPTTMFDVSPRTVCMVRPLRTNTPLQALALLNDPTYIEAARVLSEKLLQTGSADDTSRLDRAFESLTERLPDDEERKILGQSLNRLRQQYAARHDDAVKLVSVGEKPRDPKENVEELAAWTALVNMMMNLDETITKG